MIRCCLPEYIIAPLSPNCITCTPLFPFPTHTNTPSFTKGGGAMAVRGKQERANGEITQKLGVRGAGSTVFVRLPLLSRLSCWYLNIAVAASLPLRHTAGFSPFLHLHLRCFPFNKFSSSLSISLHLHLRPPSLLLFFSFFLKQ